MPTIARQWRWMLLCLPLTLVSTQSAAAGITTIVAVTGQPVPNGNGVFDSFSLLDAVINNAGQVVFRADLSGTHGGADVYDPPQDLLSYTEHVAAELIGHPRYSRYVADAASHPGIPRTLAFLGTTSQNDQRAGDPVCFWFVARERNSGSTGFQPSFYAQLTM